MKREIIICDNCGQETENTGNVKLGKRPFDVCNTCVGDHARDLAATPFQAWPTFVRKIDVRAYLERKDADADRMSQEIVRLRGDLDRLRRKNGGRERDLAQDLLNIATSRGAEHVAREVERLQDHVRRSA